MQLTVYDGFKFGCGFLLALLAFTFGLVIVGTLGLLIATMLGVSVLPR